MSVNKVMLIGYVGHDPEVRYFEGGGCVARIGLATNEFFQNREGERQEHTEWHTLVFWNRQAETIEKYVHKGDRLYVEGSLRTRRWEDKDKSIRYFTEIMVGTFRFLNVQSTRTENATSKIASQSVSAPIPPLVEEPEGEYFGSDEADDLPF